MKIKSLLAIGYLCALTTNNYAADLSATATESYQIQNKKFGNLLRPENASNKEGAPIVLYPAEPWKCMTWKLRPAGEAIYTVQNHFTSKTFTVSGSGGGTNVIQAALANETGGRPTWRFTKLADGAYQINETKSGAALTAVESDGSVRVTVAPWQDKDEQKWELRKTDPTSLTM